jgi:ribosomal protein S26
MKGKEEDVTAYYTTTVYYCISCAKHRKIFEKKKKQLQRKREREFE